MRAGCEELTDFGIQRELVQLEDGIYIFCFRPKEGARFGTGQIDDLLEAAQISPDES